MEGHKEGEGEEGTQRTWKNNTREREGNGRGKDAGDIEIQYPKKQCRGVNHQEHSITAQTAVFPVTHVPGRYRAEGPVNSKKEQIRRAAPILFYFSVIDSVYCR